MIGEIFSVESFVRTCLWQSMVLVVVGLAASFLLRRRSSRAHQILLLSIVAAVIVPVVSTLVKRYELGLFVAEPVAMQSQSEVQTVAGDFSPSGPVVQDFGYGPGPIEADLAPVTTGPQSAPLPWAPIALYVWIAASPILAIRLLVTFVLGVRLLGRAEPVDCAKMEEAVHSARTKLRIDREVEVCCSRGVRSPVIWCWRRKPVLLVPGAAGRCDSAIDWTGVLCHELAHWKRRDHISGLLAEIALCILPWHLLLWWAKSRLIGLSEQACDDWVLATGQAGADYAELLLDLTPGRQLAFVPAVVSSKKGLAGRVHRILKDSGGNPRAGAAWALAVSIAAIFLAVGIAFAQTRPAETEETKDRNSLTERFELSKDIAIELDAGPDGMRKIVHARSVRFEKTDSDIRVTLRADVRRGLPFEWKTRIELLGDGDEVLGRQDSLNKAQSLVSGQPVIADCQIEFAPFKWNEVASVQRFRTGFEQIGTLRDEIGRPYDGTRTDWIQGRVTGPDGLPVTDAIVIINEHKAKGGPFSVPRVGADEDGYYRFGTVDWPYRLGVERRQHLPSTDVDCYQLILLKQIFNGPQTVDFKFNEPPTGTASIVGLVVDAEGVPIKEFKANIMEWSDSEERDSGNDDGSRLESTWYNQEVNSDDGVFRLENVPAGKYRVRIIPKEKQYEWHHQEVVLADGKTTNSVLRVRLKHVLYGRVLFKDGSPAVLKPVPWPGAETQVLLPLGGRARRVATVGEDGYFVAYLDEDSLEQLKSARSPLIINIPSTRQGRHVTAGEFPFELLATEKNRAGVVKVNRPAKSQAASESESADTPSDDGYPLSEIDKDRVVQKFFKLTHYSPSDMSRIVTPLLSDIGHISADEDTHALFVIDTAENLIRIEKVIAQFDVRGAERFVTDIFHIYNGDPSDIARKVVSVLTELRDERIASGAPTSTSVVVGPGGQPVSLTPDLARKKIIVTASAEDMKHIAEWIEKLDEKESKIEREYEVVQLGYADAGEVAERLNEAIQQMPGSESQQRVLIQPLTQTRQIIIFGRKDLREKVKKLIAEWDVPLDTDRLRPRILTLRNSDPIRMARLLTKLFGGEDEEGVNIYEVIFGKDAEGKRKTAGPLSEQLKFEDVPGTKKIIVISNFPEAYDIVGKLILELDKQEMAAKDVKQVREWIEQLDRKPARAALPEGWNLDYDDGRLPGGAGHWPANMARDLASLQIRLKPYDPFKASLKGEEYELRIFSPAGEQMGNISIRPESEFDLPGSKVFKPGKYILEYQRRWGKPGDNFRMNCGEYPIDLSKPGMYELTFTPKIGTAEITGTLGGCYAINFEKIGGAPWVRGFAYQDPRLGKKYLLDGLPPGKYLLSAVTQRQSDNVFVDRAEVTVVANEKVTLDMARPAKGSCSLKGSILGRTRRGEWFVLIRKLGSGQVGETYAYEARTMDSLYVVRGRNITQETEDRARYQIEGIAPGSYTVTVTQHPPLRGVLRQQSKHVTLRPADNVLDFNLQITPQRNHNPGAKADSEEAAGLVKVTGLVKDPQGQPVPGTNVTLFQTKLEYVANAEGKFTAALAPSDKTRYFFAVHKRRKLVASGRLGAGEDHLEINLIPARMVSGRVVDANGRPVSGVQVAPLPMTCFHVLTDSEGRFDVGWSPKWHAPDHELCLMARHTELNLAAVVDIAPEAKTIDIELEPALALRGTVEDANGRPILGAVVGLSLIRGWGAGTPVRDVITDYQGRFELPALPQRQEYGVGANAEGYQRNAIKTGVINNITNHEEVGPIVLKRKEESKEAGRVILKLVGPDSQPVVGAWVGTFVDWSDIAESPPIWFLNDGGSYKASKIDSAAKVISDEEGKITLTEEELFKPQWPTERTVPLTAIDEGHHLAGLRELSREDLGTEVTVTLQPGCRVRGRVSAATARKRKWSRTLTVYVYWQGHRPCQYTSKEGRFEFVLPPGKYKVQVYSEDSDKDVILPILIKPGQRDLDITEYLDDESKLPAPTASIAVDAKDETFFDAIDTEGGAKDVRLVVDPRFGPRPAQAANSARERVVHFPGDRSMGKLFVRDAGPDSWYEGWQELGEAKGDVSVAAGKEVKLEISEQAAGDLSALDKLGPDDLQMLSFGWKAVRAGSLAPIGNLKGLKALNIQSARFDSDDLKHLTGLAQLEVLRFGDHKLTDGSMRYVGQLTSLRSLAMWGTGISGQGLGHLKDLTNLTFLALTGCEIGDEGLEHLGKMTALEGLQLRRTKITDKGLRQLQGFDRLKHVELGGNGITDGGLKYIENLTSLENIWIDTNPITDKGLSHLAGMKNLKELYATYTKITDAGLVNLKGMKDFHHLIISGIGDEGIRHLSELPALETLQIQDAQITKASIPGFKRMNSLSKLLLSGDSVNDDLLDALRAALANCKIWDPQRSRDYPMPEWRQRFEAVYRLEDEQVLKRIPPPFIPQRRDYYLNAEKVQAQHVSRSPDRFTFEWIGKLKRWGMGFGNGNYPLGRVLGNDLIVDRDRFEGSEELMQIQVPGDWIVREGISVGEKLKALEKILADELGRNIRFVKRTVERQAIVATGRFKFRRLSTAKDDKWVHVFLGDLDPDEGGSGGTASSVSDFLGAFGDDLDIAMINQTESSGQIQIPYRNHLNRLSSSLGRMEDQTEKAEKLTMILDNVSRQTNLQFQVTRRPVEVWHVTEADDTK